LRRWPARAPAGSEVVALALVADGENGDEMAVLDLEQHDVAGRAEGNDELPEKWTLRTAGGLSAREREPRQQRQSRLDRIDRFLGAIEIVLEKETVEPIEISSSF